MSLFGEGGGTGRDGQPLTSGHTASLVFWLPPLCLLCLFLPSESSFHDFRKWGEERERKEVPATRGHGLISELLPRSVGFSLRKEGRREEEIGPQ